jgi:GNAT superfamily N-acetyltransferase
VAETGGATRAVRAFSRADLRPAIATMVRAFEDDPVMVWLFPDEQMRRRQLPKFFAITFREVSSRHEGTELLVAGAAVLGGAIWVPPGAWRPSVWQQLRTTPRYALALGSRIGVASTTYGAIVRCHPERPHWYLSGIGTDPPVQGTGVGTELMRSRLARCDAAGQPAYLESSKERNVPFYERHGFQVIGELSLPGGGPTLWLMWRDPQDEEGR